MYEAIINDKGDNTYNIPDSFTSRTAEILQVYLKSLGVKMETIIDEDEFIGEPEHKVNIIEYRVGKGSIFCTEEERYYLRKLHKVYSKYMKKYPNSVDDDVEEVWDYITDNLPFKKKYLTDQIIKMFKDNLEIFSSEILD